MHVNIRRLLVVWVLGALICLQVSTSQAPVWASSSATMPVMLNEVMPKPETSSGAWIEIMVGVKPHRIFMPVMFLDGQGQSFSSRVQALPTINLAGWQVSNEQGQVYTLPQQLHSVPNNTMILIIYDGKGEKADDYDPSDGLLVLHTPEGVLDSFPDRMGQVALYRPGSLSIETIVDFVAWGGFDPKSGQRAVAAGVWPRGQAVSFENGFGDISEEDLLERNESIGRFPGASGYGAALWANYPAGSATPGRPNNVPPITFVTPEHGARVDKSTLALSWRASSGASGYQFQFHNKPDFIDPIIDVFVETTYYKPVVPLTSGVYYWRVQPFGLGVTSGWVGPFRIEVVDSAVRGANVSAEKVLGIARVRQNKDSYLLGLDGAPEGDPTTNTPEDAWDSPAPCTMPPCADDTKYLHGNQYCVRASIRMMASYYNGGGVLSMDRISYHVLEEWSGNTRPGANDGIPDNDLGFNRGMYYPDEEDEGISWALQTTINTPGGKPTFAQIKDWIDADRPIMFRRPGHMMVIDGYRDDASGEFVHVLDPDQPPDFERWQDYSTQTIDGYWVGPASGTARVDETSVWQDSDGDGIMDFDEVVRFDLDPYDTDTDGDWVPDKRDMREYVFDAAGNYDKRDYDLDGDGLRKERDPDNDNDGSPDGCEDTNRNGILEAGETNNFNDGDSQACVPLFNILYPLKVAPVNAGDPTAPDKILVQVSTAVPAGWTLSLTPSDFDVSIGGVAAPVLAVYPSADTHFLVVQAPVQPAASSYDLRVALVGVSEDHEAAAVYYLPKAANDEVIVLDRSGSMAANDKIDAAQNAASAFVDFLANDDMVGVVSFATAASVDFTLTAITSPTIRTNAINAIKALSASGTTALGQGAQTGYNQLTTHGDTEHHWSMVLLSDGWENVPPYWADVEGGITSAVVHTVALGDTADTTLLQSIAGAKHGQYFYVDVNPPTTQVSRQSMASPQLVVPNTLPNRLADTYTAIGELTHRYQRWAERTGSATEVRSIEFLVRVPKNAPKAMFSLNWDDPSGYLRMDVYDPGNKLVSGDEERIDETHHQLVIYDPEPGEWQVVIRVLKPTSEYHFMLSGKSRTSLLAAIGGKPEQRTVGAPIPIYGVLTDEKPIAGAQVYALVVGPGLNPENPLASVQSRILQLFDDGRHGDGRADDGVYSNLLTGVVEPGGFTVKLVATGKDNHGEPFVRYANTGFNIRSRAVYLWNDDLDTALAYEKLLEDRGWIVDLMSLTEARTARLDPYALMVVGPDTGRYTTFYDAEVVKRVAGLDMPVMGLGFGGAALFSELDLFIGFRQSWISTNYQVYAVNPLSPYWREPFTIPLNPKDPLVALYDRGLTQLGVYIPNPVRTVTPLAREKANNLHYPVVLENRSGRAFVLWGYNAGPELMTRDGQAFFVNITHNLMR